MSRSREGATAETCERASSGRRGQANLVALVAALFALASVTVVAMAVASGALADERSGASERHAATAVADRLVAADSPLTTRANVVDADAIDDVAVADLRRRYPALEDQSVRVTLGDRVIAADGSPGGGARMSRIVFVERTTNATITPGFRAGNSVTLPRRTPRVVLDLDPDGNATISAVRANNRTVLRDADGLAGEYELSITRRETVRLTFVTDRDLSQGAVEVTLFPRQTRKTQLTVTVDA